MPPSLVGLKPLAHLEEIGVAFGYPTCCIQSFLTRSATILETGIREPVHPFQAKMGNSTGFIPCRAHAMMIWEHATDRQKQIQFTKTILGRRRYPLPFPFDSQALACAALNRRSRWLLQQDFEPDLRAALWIYGALLRDEVTVKIALDEHPSKRTQVLLFQLLEHSPLLGRKLPEADDRRERVREELKGTLWMQTQA